MFVDYVEIEVVAGVGGRGAATFRTEKYVPHGGPDGGDGGNGGSVVLEADPNLSTLLDFRYKRQYKAERGGDGHRKKMFGKNGADLVLRVPAGTLASDAETGEVVADLTAPLQRAMVARGGAGGKGNIHFVSSTHQAPKFAEMGLPGESRRLKLELKLLADAGLVGMPNAGKSTLLAAVSAARPKVGDYPFTTIVPNLGVVSLGPERSFVMADLPGLIEGAHLGAGLGHQFLRHIDRTRVLVHVIDSGGLSGRDPLQDFDAIQRELSLYDERLATLPQVVALNKIDLAPSPESLASLEEALEQRGHAVFRISAATNEGVQPLLWALWNRLEEVRATVPSVTADSGPIRIVAPRTPDSRRWEAVSAGEGIWEVRGTGIENFVIKTDIQNPHAVLRLQRVLAKAGIDRKLEALGAKPGDLVRIGGEEFEYQEEMFEQGPRRRSKRGA